MSTLWRARVLELAGTRAVIELVVVHPDAGPFNDDLVFAMRLLAEPAVDGDEVRGPLGDEVKFGEAESTAWCTTHAPRFITSCRLLDPAPPRLTGNWRYAQDTAIRYELMASEPRWLAHLATGQSWDSAVYS